MPKEARSVLQDLVYERLREKGGAAAFTQRPIFAGATLTLDDPADPIAAIGEAQWLARTAEGLMRDYAKQARGAGKSWRDLVEPLGIQSDDEWADLPAMAFTWVAPTPSQRFDKVYTFWKCASCGAHVTDTGPYNGHPADDEAGHTETCERHLRDIAAYLKLQGLDDE